MEKKDISKMLRRELILELHKARAENTKKEELIQARSHLVSLRNQVQEEKRKCEELEQKLAIQDKDLQPFIDRENQNLLAKLEKIYEGNKCSFCKLKFHSETHRRAILKCGHVFGEMCIHTYLILHKNCPVCDFPAVLWDVRIIIAGENLCTANYFSS
ncbi:43 kDa receptor-associated protein of the synapse homolog [Drosophila biarmipes]|uniref:43 kDa receptor-associated protein of the synapse homolog n=1 Tax=Drosophila biarmipes TaxID=125945 RepID=UPI0021CCA2FF|nr:43 kDa receptor-associated protein of the synapse homolog [Drosophila biarmipes]